MAIKRGRQGIVGGDPTNRREPVENPTDGADNTRDNQKNSLRQRIAGNYNRAHVKTLYDSWNAAYRGLVPHGVAALPLTRGGAKARAPKAIQHRDNPAPFEEGDEPDTIADPDTVAPAVQDITPIPVIMVDDMSAEFTRMSTYWIGYVQGVTTAVDRIIARQENRVDVRIMNLGPGIVYIAENESKGTTGFALPAAMTAPILLPTTREVWAVQASGSPSAAQVNILITYERRVKE
jgi:hypothetical protein